MTLHQFLQDPEAAFALVTGLLGWLTPTPRTLSKGASLMQNIASLITSAVKFASLAYQIEKVQTDTTTDAASKRASTVALLPQFVPLVDSVAGLPAGTVEKYLTPDTLGALYDGAELAEHALAG